MQREGEGRIERRSAGTRPLRPGALRCDACGTTWFDALAQAYAATCRCRRCGGTLHGERRAPGAVAAAGRAA